MKVMSEITKKRMSESAKKRNREVRGTGFAEGNQCAKGNPTNKTSFKKGQHGSPATEFKKGNVPIYKKYPELAPTGKDCPAWKGDVTSINRRIRTSIEYRLWREAVFARDNWTCQKCNIKGGELHAHHKKSFAEYPELRFAIDNGVTLCKPCHLETSNYKNRTQVGGI